MALDVYFREDVANVIRANVLSCILAAAANGARNVEFVRGALALGQANSIAFGIDWAGVLDDLQVQARLGGWHDLLKNVRSPILSVTRNEGAK